MRRQVHRPGSPLSHPARLPPCPAGRCPSQPARLPQGISHPPPQSGRPRPASARLPQGISHPPPQSGRPRPRRRSRSSSDPFRESRARLGGDPDRTTADVPKLTHLPGDRLLLILGAQLDRTVPSRREVWRPELWPCGGRDRPFCCLGSCPGPFALRIWRLSATSRGFMKHQHPISGR